MYHNCYELMKLIKNKNSKVQKLEYNHLERCLIILTLLSISLFKYHEPFTADKLYEVYNHIIYFAGSGIK